MTDLLISRARALADFGRGARNETTINELQRVLDEAKRVGLEMAIPELEAVLSTT